MSRVMDEARRPRCLRRIDMEVESVSIEDDGRGAASRAPADPTSQPGAHESSGLED